MKSVAVVAFGAPLAELERPTPSPSGTQVLLAVRHCGVCHTDLHLRQGYFDLGGGQQLSTRLELPHVLGHEIEGEVVAAGPEAGAVRAGERYAVFPWIGCGRCSACLRGAENLCVGAARQLGCSSGCPGGYATHVLVPHRRYLIAYGDADPALAAVAMCSGLTAYAALKKLAPLAPGEPLLIVGCGGVGLMGVRFAQALYQIAPLVADLDPARLAAARAAGAATGYDAREAGVADRIRADTQGGPAAVVDFVGSEQSFTLASRVVRRGGRIVLVGLFGGAALLPLPLIPLRALTICGSYTGTLEEARELSARLRSGQISIPLERRPLSQAEAALEALGRGAVTGRVVLTP